MSDAQTRIDQLVMYMIARYRTGERMDDILQPVSFIPVIDQLLYEPQTLFADAYFGTVLDDEPLRDHPERFMHGGPPGRLYYEKLRDLLEPGALRVALYAMIHQGAPFRRAARDAYGSSLDWFFHQWSLPYPRVDYGIVDISSHQRDDGLHDHAVTVERRIAAGDTPIVEPVTVRVVLTDGTRHDLRWDGRGSRGVVRLRARAGIDVVELDPAGRLIERKLPGQTDHPRLDNRSKPRVRFVYNSTGVLLDVTDLSALLVADFTLGRAYDLRQQMRLRLFSSASSLAGGSVSYRRSFGREITPDRLHSHLTFHLGGERLRTGFFGDVEPRPATQLTLGVRLGQSSRQFVFHPKNDVHASLGASLTLTRRDAHEARDADLLASGRVSGWLARVYTPVGGHTLAGELSAGLVAGNLETRAQLIAAGGAEGVRGYAPAALFGRAFAMARAEYRHVFVHDLAWNFGHFNVVRGVGGALFADALALSPCDSYDLTRGDSFRASVGYGLRFFYDSFGTLPLLMRIDVAARLTGRSRDCLGAESAGSPPVAVYISFWPPF